MVITWLNEFLGKPNTLTINPVDDEGDGSFSKRSGSDVGELHAIARRAARNRKKAYGKTVLYFGCRNSQMDHIYKEELEKAKMSGALDNFHVAFSRDKEVMEKVVKCGSDFCVYMYFTKCLLC